MRRLFSLLALLLFVAAVAEEEPLLAPATARPAERYGTASPAMLISVAKPRPKLPAFGRIADEGGSERVYRLGVVQVKRNGRLEAWSVEPGTERAAALALAKAKGVEFAELEYVLERQSLGLDHPAGQQWHHEAIGSTNAWAISLGYSSQREPLVRLAILDTPFQMDHPDLRDHAVPGWSLLTRSELPLETNGYYHSTLAAGLAGAVLKNGLGVAGAVNCLLVPVDIGNLPTTRDMHDAVVWAADHGIRVVNLSWGGAFSSVINEAGLYLKQKARGMLFMAGMNEQRFLNYPEQPHIYAISMTDRNDQARSAWGEHIDFSAPGWDIYSTTTNSGYETDSGTSYSAPLAAGVAAWIMSADPALEPDEIEGILRETCVDLGEPGRDQRHGWGRIDFGRAARRVYERSAISRVKPLSDGAEAVHEAGTAYRLLRAADVRGPWEALTNVQQEPGGGRLKLRDLEGAGPAAFYKVEITRPQ